MCKRCHHQCTVDHDLFGGKDVYLESLENLCDSKSVQIEKVNGLNMFKTYAKHPVSFNVVLGTANLSL
jgi:hypothetical protein